MLSVLTNVQLERAAALPAKFTDNPFRAVTLDAIQRRNAVLDAVFYDVNAVTHEETPDLAFWLAREGAIILVPPTGEGRLRVFLTPQDYLQKAAPVAALAVAGVGSSALGAAAFARNIADGLGQPVAAVVSGYGIADILTEALGGFFWFGALNSIRHVFEPLDAFTKMFSRTELLENGNLWTRTSKDTETVVALLEDERFSPRVLAGHSKGTWSCQRRSTRSPRSGPTLRRRFRRGPGSSQSARKSACPPPLGMSSTSWGNGIGSGR